MHGLLAKLNGRLAEAFAYAGSLVAHAGEAMRRARRDGLTPLQAKRLRTVIGGMVVAIVLCLPMGAVVAGIASNPEALSSYVEQNLLAAGAMYALANTLALFAAVIPGKPLEIVAGYLFGTWGGLLVVLCGIALGEVAVFLIVRRFGMRVVGLFVSPEKIEDITLFNDSKRLGVVAFLMMFIPGTPKDIVTYIVGLTPMSLPTWLAISLPARTMSILSSTVVGDQAARDHWGVAVAIEAVMLVVSVLGVAYYLLITKQARTDAIMARVAHEEWLAAGSPSNDAASARDLPASGTVSMGGIGTRLVAKTESGGTTAR